MSVRIGYCGINCDECAMGNGDFAETAKKLKNYIKVFGLSQWIDELPGGYRVDMRNLKKALDILSVYTRCAGCREMGGPTVCPIRDCAQSKGLKFCYECDELDKCKKFDWLGEPQKFKERLKQMKESAGDTP